MSDTASGEFEPSDPASERAEWRLRPWLLAALFGAAGLLVHLATDGHDEDPGRIAVAAFLLFGALAAGFTLEPGRWKAPSLFALLVGLVMAGLAWRAVRYGESLPDEEYGFAAGAVASALALPLFQADFHRRRLATPYREIFGHVWSDAISAAGMLAFTGISWVVLAFLSELFALLKIELLRDLMQKGWFAWTFSGLAAGAALGTIRNQLKVLATMQTVVLLVASLLAVPLALGLVVFLLATVVSGPQVLWDATRSATPLLLACAAGSFVLANAIARQDDAAMTRSRVMRAAGLVLAAVILPLAVFAAVSMGLRLDQYGLAPERLWALVAIVVACVCGVGYWVALLRGRKGGWAGPLRQATFHVGLFVCGLAVLLALPVLDFGAISTRNQVARLASGAVPVDEFDFAALRWDFGEPGRRALRGMAQSGNAKVAELARSTLAQTERVYARASSVNRTRREIGLTVRPEDPALRELVLDYLVARPWRCERFCAAVDLGPGIEGRRRVALVEGSDWMQLNLPEPPGTERTSVVDLPESAELTGDSTIEIREVSRRYIFVDGKPIGEPLDELEADAPPR